MELPAPQGCAEPPVWTGHGFCLGGETQPVLAYNVGQSGWTDELTSFHEEVAGDDHYIDRASRQHAVSRVQRWLTSPAGVVLDIGCSSGFMVQALRAGLPSAIVMGADYVRGPLEKLAANLPDVPLLQFDLLRCPLPSQCIDAAVLLNVLEHLEDDGAALRQVYRILKPAGIAVIEVPAGPELYDVYDKQLLHHRRYEMRGLLKLLDGCGFEIAEKSHLGFFLYLPFRIVKKKNQRHLKASDDVQRAIVAGNIRQSGNSRLLHSVMRAESWLRDRLYFPFGIRCLVVARRRA